MSEITLQKTHALLEKLAEYVMSKIPRLEADLAKNADLQRVEEKISRLIDGVDHQAKEIDDFRIEKKAISYTLDVHEQRLAALEERTFGRRVRDKSGEPD